MTEAEAKTTDSEKVVKSESWLAKWESDTVKRVNGMV